MHHITSCIWQAPIDRSSKACDAECNETRTFRDAAEMYRLITGQESARLWLPAKRTHRVSARCEIYIEQERGN